MTNRGAVEVGFIPLVDCAPLVVAREMGFADEEGLDLSLRKANSWSAVRDRLWQLDVWRRVWCMCRVLTTRCLRRERMRGA